MDPVRLGSTCSSSRHSVDTVRPPEADNEEAYKDEHDPEKLVQCPFDSSHKIRACRFPYHIIKCRKNHPKLASELKTCPFNARHLMPKHELSYHVANCPDRQMVKTETYNADVQKWHVPFSNWANPACVEDWDQEADANVTPFVWGVSTTRIPQSQEHHTTSFLTSARRAPRTLPWNEAQGKPDPAAR
ncbi:gametocyte-specific factor 1-like [Arapaima gigas]